MNKINELLPQAWKYQDEFLSFMQATIEIKKEMEVYEQEA